MRGGSSPELQGRYFPFSPLVYCPLDLGVGVPPGGGARAIYRWSFVLHALRACPHVSTNSCDIVYSILSTLDTVLEARAQVWVEMCITKGVKFPGEERFGT